jgi:peptide/nickel transport system substrate-binding protein
LKQRQERKFDAIMMSWTSSLDSDPYQIWHSTQEKDGGSNAGAYANKRVDELMEKARLTLDRETRNKLYQEMSVIIADEQPYLFLFERPHLFVGTKRFERVLPVGLLGLDPARWFTPPGREVFKGAQLAK